MGIFVPLIIGIIGLCTALASMVALKYQYGLNKYTQLQNSQAQISNMLGFIVDCNLSLNNALDSGGQQINLVGAGNPSLYCSPYPTVPAVSANVANPASVPLVDRNGNSIGTYNSVLKMNVLNNPLGISGAWGVETWCYSPPIVNCTSQATGSIPAYPPGCGQSFTCLAAQMAPLYVDTNNNVSLYQNPLYAGSPSQNLYQWSSWSTNATVCCAQTNPLSISLDTHTNGHYWCNVNDPNYQLNTCTLFQTPLIGNGTFLYANYCCLPGYICPNQTGTGGGSQGTSVVQCTGGIGANGTSTALCSGNLGCIFYCNPNAIAGSSGSTSTGSTLIGSTSSGSTSSGSSSGGGGGSCWQLVQNFCNPENCANPSNPAQGSSGGAGGSGGTTTQVSYTCSPPVGIASIPGAYVMGQCQSQ